MKVLWFSNSPAAAFGQSIKGTGGWMSALDKAIQNHVELHVAFLYPYKKEVFQNGKTWYHPIYTGNIVYESIKKRLFRRGKKNLKEAYLRVIEFKFRK